LVNQQHELHRFLLLGWLPLRRTAVEGIDKFEQRNLEAEGVGFEPTKDLTALNGFRDRGVHPGNPVVEPRGRVGGTSEGTKTGRSAQGGVKMHACMRISRHARNEMRLYSISPQDVQATVMKPARREVDDRGNARLTGETGDGRPILVVVARDDPDFVITVFLRS